MLMLKYKTTLLTMFMAFSHVAIGNELGQTLATQGNSKGATACIACHGVDGAGMAAASFPRLAGINPAYMEKQLHDFAKATRNSAIMAPIASALSDEEIKAVAAYYSKLKLITPSVQATTDDTLMEVGKKLAEKGNWPNDVPACFTCHGAGANGIGDPFPALAGQHASYIEQQLQYWRSGQRNNDPNELMKGVAVRLSDAEIKAVSAYLASLTLTAN